MKTIIAGDRNFQDYELMKESIEESGFEITTVISGCARGADTLGEQWAEENNVPVEKFPAQWALHGKAAGPIRNGEMAKVGEALIAFLAPHSKGTKNMINQATKKGLKVFVKEI